MATLLCWQKGKCTFCGLFFTTEDLPELDHILLTSLGGKDGYDNRQLLHLHCHDTRTAGQRLPASQG